MRELRRVSNQSLAGRQTKSNPHRHDWTEFEARPDIAAALVATGVAPGPRREMYRAMIK